MKRMQASPASNESFNASLHFLLHFFTCSAAKLQFLLLPGRGVSSRGGGRGYKCIACALCAIRNPFAHVTHNNNNGEQRGRYFTRQRNSKAKFLPYSNSRDIYPAHRSSPAYSPHSACALWMPCLFSAFKCFTVSFHSPSLSLCCSLLLCCLRCLRLLSVF